MAGDSYGGSTSAPPPRSIVVYTAITDRRDDLVAQLTVVRRGAEFVAFLDDATARGAGSEARGWQVRRIDRSNDRGTARDAVLAAKVFKMLPHRYFPDAEFSLWLDGRVAIVYPLPLARLVDLFLRDADLCVFRHSARRTVEEEARVCVERRLDDPARIAAQLERYRRDGMPSDAPLIEASVLLRRHTRATAELGLAWWDEVQRGSTRDQLSFPYVAWKIGLRYATFPLDLRKRNGLFVRRYRAPKRPIGPVTRLPSRY